MTADICFSKGQPMANGRNMALQCSAATVAQMVSSGVRAERHMTIRLHGFPCPTMCNTAEIEGDNTG